jgi:chromosome segregation ATPase
MRLPFGAPPTPDPRQVAEAQWALVAAIEQTAASSYVPADIVARHALEELLRAVRSAAASPQQWAAQMARRLLALVADLRVSQQSCAAQHAQLEWLQSVCKQLQAHVDAHNADPLAVQVQELTADLTEAEADAARLDGRVRELETALAGQAKTYEAEVARLQEQITNLNRIVGSQQRKLNDLLVPPD